MSTGVHPASFYADLERLLRQQLRANPAQPDLRLKLIEVYYETGRGSEFEREIHALGAVLDEPDYGADRARVASMGRELGLTGARFAHVGALPRADASAGSARARPQLRRRIGDDGRYREPLTALAAEFAPVYANPEFRVQLDRELEPLAQRPSALHDARRLTQAFGGARILLKREDRLPDAGRLLLAIAGQGLVARTLGRTTLVTSTCSGPRGLLTAQVAARLGLRAIVFMDRDDLERHRQLAFQMRLLGADVRPVTCRELTERDVRLPALDFWAQSPCERFPVMGLDSAPPPYDLVLREIPSLVGREARRQVLTLSGRLPDLIVARGGETADAIGLFEPFLADATTRLACVAPSRDLGIRRKDDPRGAAGPSADALQRIAHADLALREQAPVLREHGFLRASGRVEYASASPEAARKALLDLSGLEGVTPSIDTAHALAWACAEAARLPAAHNVVVMVAERADAELPDLARLLDGQL